MSVIELRRELTSVADRSPNDRATPFHVRIYGAKCVRDDTLSTVCHHHHHHRRRPRRQISDKTPLSFIIRRGSKSSVSFRPRKVIYICSLKPRDASASVNICARANTRTHINPQNPERYKWYTERMRREIRTVERTCAMGTGDAKVGRSSRTCFRNNTIFDAVARGRIQGEGRRREKENRWNFHESRGYRSYGIIVKEDAAYHCSLNYKKRRSSRYCRVYFHSRNIYVLSEKFITFSYRLCSYF